MACCAPMVSCVVLSAILHSARSSGQLIKPSLTVELQGNLDAMSDLQRIVSNLDRRDNYNLKEDLFSGFANVDYSKTILDKNKQELPYLMTDKLEKALPLLVINVPLHRYSKSCFIECCNGSTHNVNNYDGVISYRLHYNAFLEDLQNILHKTNTLLNEWKEYKKFYLTTAYSSYVEEIDDKMKELIFVIIPNIIKQLILFVETELSTINSTKESDLLQSPFLLSAPAVQQSVSETGRQSFVDTLLKQFHSKERSNKPDKENTNSESKRRSDNPYFEHYNDWQWPVAETEENENERLKTRLDKTIRTKDNLIKRMTALENELENLKFKNNQNPNKQYEIKIARLEKELELLEERNSELYYKKQLLSENNSIF